VIETQTVVNLLQQTREGRKLMVTGNPVFDGQGNLTRVVVNERDITEIDRLHRELEHQEAISDQIRRQMLHMQLEEVEARRIVSRSPAMMNVLRQALKVGAVDSNVLILGESGTGKGLIADLIHKHSRRSGSPMIKINCGAIPESLMESELFGYERGAFTGAHKAGKPGHVELADKGILFLDEIAELPLASQVKLLRFLEDGCSTRIGGTASRKLDVRVLAATNRDLEKSVEERHFRRDLYYRLNVIPIHIPPLRERREDILPLIQHFMAHFGEKLDARKQITSAALDALLACSYPGNVRELMNLCERLVVMSEGPRIDVTDLPSSTAGSDGRELALHDITGGGGSFRETLEDFEKTVLKRAMAAHTSQQSMAEALGVNQSTIARKLKKYGLVKS
jgi:TyrR family helix-turn-helix protein